MSVLGAVSCWGFAKETIAALLPSADRALDRIRDYGDRDGDGFVEYGRLDLVLPEAYGDLHITNARMARGRITIDISGSTASIQGLSKGMALHRGHRPWMTELVEQAKLRKEP